MEKIILRLDDNAYCAIKDVAVRNKQTVSEVIRRIFGKHAETMAAEAGAETIAAIVRAETRRALQVTENRLIKILAKTTSAAATNMYLSVQCIAAANKRDAVETQQRARAKAVEYLK